jgi:hypothetical protein
MPSNAKLILGELGLKNLPEEVDGGDDLGSSGTRTSAFPKVSMDVLSLVNPTRVGSADRLLSVTKYNGSADPLVANGKFNAAGAMSKRGAVSIEDSVDLLTVAV